MDLKSGKGNRWVGSHLGSFIQNNGKDVTSTALKELCVQLQDGRFRELKCTIEVDRDSKCLIIRRWLDNVILEEFSFTLMSNVMSHNSIPGNNYLGNLVSFTTPKKVGGGMDGIEIHVFQFENFKTANYLASDIRSGIEESSANSKHAPVKVLPSFNKDKLNTKSDLETLLRNEEITSKTERNLLLLNYCFDDIEVFLQHLNDQEEAQKLLKLHKNKASDRLLEGKAKPSTKAAYETCIQKIKFSLNLLSKLHGKIKDPDSYQLSTLLIENLVRINQAFIIYHSGKLNKIQAPLLLEETIKLLSGCLNKQQYRQFSSWGDCWIKPREKWSGYKEKYYPEFFNGHQIDLEHLEKDGLIQVLPKIPHAKPNNADVNNLIESNQTPLKRKSMDVSEILTKRQEDFCRSVMVRNGRLYRVTTTFIASKDEELSISQSEIIEVVEERADRNWWLCSNMHGDRGYVPKTIIEPFQFVDTSLNARRKSSPSMSPTSFYRIDSKRSDTSAASSQLNQAEVKTVQDELEKKLTTSTSSNFGNFNARASFARPGPVVSRKHGQLSINQDSTEDDVVRWLRFKKFREKDIEVLNKFNGKYLFLMTREQMNRLLGKESGGKLDSLVKVQKSLSGFGSMSKRELEEILMKRKEKVDFLEQF